MPEPHIIHLADHSFVLALPAFGPAVVVAGVVLYAALRDRRKREAPPHTENAGSPGHERGDRDGS
jgi:hypothetical protein